MATTRDQAIEKYLMTARQAGCPADQMLLFGRGGYVALPHQLRFHASARTADAADGPVKIGLGGARGPGKSHACLAQAGLDDCQRVDGLKWLFLRKLAKSAYESFEDLINRVFVYTPHRYAQSTGQLEFSNGSRIRLGGFNHENDVDGYIGIEYDGIIVEEATMLSEMKLLMLEGSLRTSRRDWRPRMYLSTNPGGIGHAYFKRIFVQPYRAGETNGTRFIPSTYRDNPFLNKEYRDYLEALPGALGKAWRDGDWDSFEGQALPSWQDDVHVVDPFEIPESWTRIAGYDWGYAAPMAFLWAAQDPDTRRIVIYRELYEAKLTDRQQVNKVISMTPPYEKISMYYADPSIWETKSLDVVTSTATIWQQAGITLTKASNNRLSGKRKVDRLLGLLPDGKPGLMVFRNCVNVRRTFPELVSDDVEPEDVDTDGEDHLYDALRYLLTTIRDQSEPPRKAQENPFSKLRNI
jgi:phage terminase large subunit